MQSKANAELELKTLALKLEQEAAAHRDTVAKFNADKKHILMSTEEANLEAIKGEAHVYFTHTRTHRNRHTPSCPPRRPTSRSSRVRGTHTSHTHADTHTHTHTSTEEVIKGESARTQHTHTHTRPPRRSSRVRVHTHLARTRARVLMSSPETAKRMAHLTDIHTSSKVHSA